MSNWRSVLRPIVGRSGRRWATPPASGCPGYVASAANPARSQRRSLTPFTTARGTQDLETFLDADALVEALDSTFRIVENCLDRWTLDSLDEEIHRTFGQEEWVGIAARSSSERLFTISGIPPS